VTKQRKVVVIWNEIPIVEDKDITVSMELPSKLHTREGEQQYVIIKVKCCG
jgi:hypothetical protein